jgi:regulatory protein
MDYLKTPHSEKELRSKLTEKGCTQGDIDEVCALCLDYGFLDDQEYGAMIVRHYAAKGYGLGRIKTELNRRGVPKELWDEALEQLPEDTEMIDRLLAAKLRGRDLSDRAQWDKAANALFRRGYSWSEIRAAMERYRE